MQETHFWIHLKVLSTEDAKKLNSDNAIAMI